jgi:hypothetical protein
MNHKFNKDLNNYKVGSIVSYNIVERGDSFFAPTPIFRTSIVTSISESFAKDRIGVDVTLVMENGDVEIIRK